LEIVPTLKTICGARNIAKVVLAVGIAGSQHFNNVWKT
jgi:hypothetical protein